MNRKADGRVLTKLRGLWREPSLRNTDLDSPAGYEAHRRILRSKKSIRRIYRRHYEDMLLAAGGRIALQGKACVEIGSGGGFFREALGNVIRTDLLTGEGIDLGASAFALPFKEKSIDFFFLHSVFHHFSSVREFFSEAERCLKPGGAVIIYDPLVDNFFARRFFRLHPEGTDETASEWEFESEGPLSHSNQALLYICFIRDREQFSREFPGWRLRWIKRYGGIEYLLCGGLNYRSLMPDLLLQIIGRLEEVLLKFLRIHTNALIRLERKPE